MKGEKQKKCCGDRESQVDGEHFTFFAWICCVFVPTSCFPLYPES